MCKFWGRNSRGLASHYAQKVACQKSLSVDGLVLPNKRRTPRQSTQAPPATGDDEEFQEAGPAPPEEDPACQPPPVKRPRVSVEEVDDEGDPVFIEQHPTAGKSFKEGDTLYETKWSQRLQDDEQSGKPPWAPFADLDEMEHTQWLWSTGASLSAIDKGLKLKIVSDASNRLHIPRSNRFFQTKERTQLSHQNVGQLLTDIDALPHCPDFHRAEFTVTGDILDKNGNPEETIVEIFTRNPVECVRELIGNPQWKGNMEYKPRRVYTGPDKQKRVYDEMWTGDWWWEIQVSDASTHAGVFLITHPDWLGAAWRRSNRRADHPIIR